MSVEELEYCYYEYACMTGCLPPYGLGFLSGFAWIDELIIGSIDAPDCMPAGGLEFIDDALGYGVFAQLVHRECHAD